MAMLAVLVSCSKDGKQSPNASEAHAEKAVSGSGTCWSAEGPFATSSAFMYKTAQDYCFLLCEGEVDSWSKGKEKQHLEIHIWEGWIETDIAASSDPSRAIDINGSEKKVYVRWNPGNGERYFDKNNYAVATGNYTFLRGNLSVTKTAGMVMIVFTGTFDGGKLSGADVGWTYSGTFKGLK